MAQAGIELEFDCEVLPQALFEAEAPVSATAIRAALEAGDLETVERQLGRRYSLRGPVIHGDERGRTIGFATANIGVTADRALPAFGVYATWAYLDDERFASVTNIGRRPTFDGERTSVETHIFGFDRDIYDRQLRIELVARLREEQKFSGIEELKAQIGRDADEASRILTADAS
jgi:riboflavin kinase/FMN adenylyltransferase